MCGRFLNELPAAEIARIFRTKGPVPNYPARRVSDRLLPMLMWGFMAAGLAGCVSAAELNERDQAQCAGYGFKPGTTEFAQCMQQENLARQYELSQPTWGPYYPYYRSWGPWGPLPY